MKRRIHNKILVTALFILYMMVFVCVVCARKNDLQKGIDALKKGEYGKALNPLKAALAQDSLDPLIHYNLSFAYGYLDSTQKSFHHYLKLVDMGSTLKDSITLKEMLTHVLQIEPYPSSPIPMRGYNQFKGAPSPDGQFIAVAAAKRDIAQIYLVELDGRIKKKITTMGSNNDPIFSPEGDRIVYVSNRDGDEELYLYTTATGEVEQLTNNTARDFFPSFSPDGQEIVFVSNMDDIHNWEIYKINITHRKIARLTKNKYWDGFPKFTQDGKSIVFSSRRNGSEDIYIMNKNGGGQKVLYTSPADENDPVLHSGKLYFKSDRDGEWEIYQFNLENNFLVRLTYNGYPDWNPRISHDGSKLFISRKIRRYWHLYFINLNQPISTVLITQKINEKISDKIIDYYLGTRHLIVIIGLILSVPETILGQNIFGDEQNRYARVRQARENSGEKIDSLFNSKAINYPPEEILVVAYKKEQILELWARPETLETFTLVKQYPFTAFSGILGPKRKLGDLQIPEGFYYINHFNPVSAFHLSLKINYPNRSDAILGERGNLGGEIRIHGSAVTIGCIPIGNGAIEELYIICVDTKSAGQEDIPVYIFPCHMDSLGMAFLKTISESDIEVFSFWQNLKKGYDIFDKTHRELKFRVDELGNYIFLNKICGNSNSYAWHTDYNTEHALVNRVGAPEGFTRVLSTNGSFGDWLRYLALKEGNPPVFLYNGTKKSYQEGHHAVISIDIGTQDLQQCADAVIRLYAEYLYSHSNFDKIEFRLTNGDLVRFRKWISGYRPRVQGNQVTWHEQTQPDSSYENFKRYLTFIFTYAGTYSLSQQLRPLADVTEMEIGDIFIQGGFPGHAVMVVDMAQHTETGEKIFLLCQSFMPAQDIHILKNLYDIRMSPWYRLEFGDSLYTPEWIFTRKDLKKF